jgi:hypothetical protein
MIRNKSYDELTPFISGLHFHDFDFDQEALLFDPSLFKADRQVRNSQGTLQIMNHSSVIISSAPHFRGSKESLVNTSAFEDRKRIALRKPKFTLKVYMYRLLEILIPARKANVRTKPFTFVHITEPMCCCLGLSRLCNKLLYNRPKLL